MSPQQASSANRSPDGGGAADLVHLLRERTKELELLHAVSLLALRGPDSLAAALQAIVAAMPAAWQYPGDARARVRFGEQCFASEGFRTTDWLQSAPLELSTGEVGALELCYLRAHPPRDEGPFLREERALLNSLARQIERLILGARLERSLRVSNARLAAANRRLRGSKRRLRIHAQLLATTNVRLSSARDELRAIVDASPDPIIALASDGSVVTWSRAAERVFGWSAEEVVGRPPPYFPPGSVEEHVALRERVARGETLAGIELERQRRDGSRLRVALSTAPVRDAKGRLLGTMGILSDLTERERLDALRRTSDELFRIAFEQGSIGRALTLPDGRFERVNRALCAMLGYAANELQGMDCLTVTHPDDREQTREFMRQFHAAERLSGQLVKRYLHRNGETVWTEVSTTLLRDEANAPLRYITDLVDITERRRAEESLATTESLMRAMIDCSPVALYSVDPAGLVTTWNRSAERVFGWSASEVIGRPLPLVPPEYQSEFGKLREQVLGGEAFLGKELLRQRRDGTRFLVSLSVAPIRSASGQVVGVMGAAEDITERVALQARISQADRLASLGLLAAGLAHELNNPLTFLLGGLETLHRELSTLDTTLRAPASGSPAAGPPPRPGLESSSAGAQHPDRLDALLDQFSDVLSGARRIRDVTQLLSSFSRPDPTELAPVELGPVLDAALSLAQNQIRFRARLRKEYGETRPVLAHQGRLTQAFLNLLLNAAQSIGEGDVAGNEISLRTWATEDCVHVEVRDTGKGIPHGDLARLFEPFFSTKGVGGGLGLSVTRSIVESYAGSIAITSELGRGTCCTVRLPAATPITRTATPAPPPPPTRARILVIDDEAAIRRAIARVLADHETVLADSGRTAKALLEEDLDFDLILCDMMMSDLSGMELHQWLATARPALSRRVAFVTGGAFTPHARDYLSRVEVPRIDKPFEPAELRRRVAELLASLPVRSGGAA